jgi:trigger factor
MKISRENVSPEIERIKLQFSPSDYWDKYKKELAVAAQKTDFKGFRKGKTPMSFVQKTQGQSILYRIIYDMINKTMQDFLTEEKVEFSFSPIPADTQKPFTFDPKDKEEFEFEFDLLIKPTLDEFKGWGTENEYDYLVVEDLDKQIDEEIMRLREANTEPEDVEEIVPGGSTALVFELKPLDKESEGEEFSMKFIWTEFTEDFAKKLEGKVLGDEIEASAEEALLEDFRKNFEAKYATSMEDKSEEENPEIVVPDDLFQRKWLWTIDEITVSKVPELDDDFLKKLSPPGQDPIESVEKLREIIADNIKHGIRIKSNNLVFKEFSLRVKERNDFSIPKKFVDEFILEGKESRELTEEEKKGVMFQVLIGKLSDKFDLSVSEDEIKAFLFEQIKGQFGQHANPQIIQMLMDRMLQDENSRREAQSNVFTGKLIEKVVDEVEKVEKVVTLDELEEAMEEAFPARSEEE